MTNPTPDGYCQMCGAKLTMKGAIWCNKKCHREYDDMEKKVSTMQSQYQTSLWINPDAEIPEEFRKRPCDEPKTPTPSTTSSG
jgi:hypothetical protein